MAERKWVVLGLSRIAVAVQAPEWRGRHGFPSWPRAARWWTKWWAGYLVPSLSLCGRNGEEAYRSGGLNGGMTFEDEEKVSSSC